MADRPTAQCDAVLPNWPETVCTEPAGHTGCHGGPLIADGRKVGGAGWDDEYTKPPALAPARPRPDLVNLVDRACRVKLTAAEGAALRRAVADLRAERDTYRRAWHSAKARARKQHARAERAEQQLAAVRALHTSSQETRGVGRGSPWRPYCDHCHQDWPCATIRALDGAQQPETDVVFEGPHTHAPQCGGCDRELSGQAYCRHNGDGIYGTWVAPDACACPQQPEPPREGSVR